MQSSYWLKSKIKMIIIILALYNYKLNNLSGTFTSSLEIVQPDIVDLVDRTESPAVVIIYHSALW